VEGSTLIRKPARSSNLDEIGYDHDVNLLEIRFKNGGVYQYSGVPVSIYKELMSAPSEGSYFHHCIRDKYPCIKVR